MNADEESGEQKIWSKKKWKKSNRQTEKYKIIIIYPNGDRKKSKKPIEWLRTCTENMNGNGIRWECWNWFDLLYAIVVVVRSKANIGIGIKYYKYECGWGAGVAHTIMNILSNEISIGKIAVNNNNRWAELNWNWIWKGMMMKFRCSQQIAPRSTLHAHNSNRISTINIFISIEMWISKYFGTFRIHHEHGSICVGTKFICPLHCTCVSQSSKVFFFFFDFDLVVGNLRRSARSEWQIIIIRKTI